MDDTRESFLSHLKETNPIGWASCVLGELHSWLSKRTDCRDALRLELPEKRRELAEAVNLALEEIDGKVVLGISNGKSSLLMRCRSEDKAQILEQIGQEIAEDTRVILVNISNGEDISVTQQRHSQDVGAEIEHAIFLLWGLLSHLRHKNDPTGLLRLEDSKHRAELAEALGVVLHELTQRLGIQDVTEIGHQ